MDISKKDIYCLVLLEKNGLPIDELNSKYFDLFGTKINYDKSKYTCLEDVILSMPDCLKVKNVHGRKMVFAYCKKEVEGLKKLIDEQKCKKKSRNTFRQKNSSRRNNDKDNYKFRRNEDKENYKFRRNDDYKKKYSTTDKRFNNDDSINNKPVKATESFNKKTTENFRCRDEKVKKIQYSSNYQPKYEEKNNYYKPCDSLEKIEENDNEILDFSKTIEQEIIEKMTFFFKQKDDSFFLDHLISKYNKTFKDPLPEDWLKKVQKLNFFNVQYHNIGNRELVTVSLYNK